MKGALPLGVALAALSLSNRGGARARAVVHHRERARGVVPQLLELLDAWEAEGLHDVEISPWSGGLRTDAATQAELAANGASNAKTLAQTPHGRGAALDVWPLGFADYANGRWADVPPELVQRFAAFGEFAEARGLVWGGRWSGASFPNGDQPHVEVRGWQSLPFPPRSP